MHNDILYILIGPVKVRRTRLGIRVSSILQAKLILNLLCPVLRHLNLGRQLAWRFMAKINIHQFK